MAAGTSLKLKFDTMSGSKTWTYKYANPSATSQQVKALGQAMIDNGSIYQNVPMKLVSAIQVITEETEYDLS